MENWHWNDDAKLYANLSTQKKSYGEWASESVNIILNCICENSQMIRARGNAPITVHEVEKLREKK